MTTALADPAHSDPTKLVRWEPQTFDEMMLGYVEYYVPGRPVPAPIAPDSAPGL